MKDVGGQTNMILCGLKVTAKTRTFVDIGSVIDVFCESMSVPVGKPKITHPSLIHCVIKNQHTKKFSKYELYPASFSPLHTLEPYIIDTNLLTLGFFTLSQYFASETVRLTQTEILEGVGRVGYSWTKVGGSLSRTRWIYNQLKHVKQVAHLLNEPLPPVIAFDENLSADVVSTWVQKKSGKIAARAGPSASIIKDEAEMLAEIVASPVPRNVGKRTPTDVGQPSAKKARVDEGVKPVASRRMDAPLKATVEVLKQSTARPTSSTKLVPKKNSSPSPSVGPSAKAFFEDNTKAEGGDEPPEVALAERDNVDEDILSDASGGDDLKDPDYVEGAIEVAAEVKKK
ncbi:unnamed protein product [Calypogeia fissa]